MATIKGGIGRGNLNVGGGGDGCDQQFQRSREDCFAGLRQREGELRANGRVQRTGHPDPA